MTEKIRAIQEATRPVSETMKACRLAARPGARRAAAARAKQERAAAADAEGRKKQKGPQIRTSGSAGILTFPE